MSAKLNTSFRVRPSSRPASRSAFSNSPPTPSRSVSTSGSIRHTTRSGPSRSASRRNNPIRSSRSGRPGSSPSAP